MNLIPYRVRNRALRWWFDRQCADVLNTPPVQCDPASEVVIVSQLYHPDMAMYLLAAKSFARWVRPRGFVIVDDGLSADDRSSLQHHLGQVEFRPSGEVPMGDCPRGGCWERLLTLSDVSRSAFAIQLDADTLTLAEPVEVKRCVQQGRSFTMGTPSGTHFVSFEAASVYALARVDGHVQNLSECHLAQHPEAANMRYVRGCAGFTGFARGQLPRAQIDDFSRTMTGLLGDATWRTWGTEQVTSNVMAANAPNAEVLPVERYPFFVPDKNLSTSTLVHFFGAFRFKRGAYIQLGRQVIRQLQTAC